MWGATGDKRPRKQRDSGWLSDSPPFPFPPRVGARGTPLCPGTPSQLPFLLFILIARTEPIAGHPTHRPKFLSLRRTLLSPFKLGEEEEVDEERRNTAAEPGARSAAALLSAGAAGLCLPRGLSDVAGVGFPPPLPLFPSAGDWPRPVKVRKGTGEKGTQRPPSPTSPQ